MFRKLILAGTAAVALGGSAIALASPSQARDWDRNGQAYGERYDGGYGEQRRGDDEDYGYRRPHHAWGWGWRQPRVTFGFGYNQGWNQHRAYYAPRHRWHDEQYGQW